MFLSGNSSFPRSFDKLRMNGIARIDRKPVMPSHVKEYLFEMPDLRTDIDYVA